MPSRRSCHLRRCSNLLTERRHSLYALRPCSQFIRNFIQNTLTFFGIESSGSGSLPPVLLAANAVLFSISLGPMSKRSGTPLISQSKYFCPACMSLASTLTRKPDSLKIDATSSLFAIVSTSEFFPYHWADYNLMWSDCRRHD